MGKATYAAQAMNRQTCDARYHLKNQTTDSNDNQITGLMDPSATKHALSLQYSDGRFVRKVVHGYMTMI